MNTAQSNEVSVRRQGGGVAPKWIVLGVVAVLVVILVFQNMQGVPLRFFFWEFTAPTFLILLIALALGFLVGLVVSALFRRRNSRRGL